MTISGTKLRYPRVLSSDSLATGARSRDRNS